MRESKHLLHKFIGKQTNLGTAVITACFAYVLALAVGDALFMGCCRGRTIKIGDRISLLYALLNLIGIAASVWIGLDEPRVFGWLRFSLILFVYLLLGVHYHLILVRSNQVLLVTGRLVGQRFAASAALIISALLLVHV